MTDEEIRKQARALLAARTLQEIAAVLREEDASARQAAEIAAQGPDWAPLDSAAWGKLKAYLLTGTTAFSSDAQAARAVAALKGDSQAEFWRAMLLLFKARTRELPHLNALEVTP